MEKLKEQKEQVQRTSESQPDEEPPPPLTEEERREKRLEEGIGLPHAFMDTFDKDDELFGKVLVEGRFPSIEEVLDGLGKEI